MYKIVFPGHRIKPIINIIVGFLQSELKWFGTLFYATQYFHCALA